MIKRNNNSTSIKGKCDFDCPFLDSNVFDTRGKCLLFNEALTPKTKFGEVEAWETCNDCDIISGKLPKTP